MSNWTDIGYSHEIQFTSWSPDRDLNPQYAGVPDIEKYGLLVRHPHKVTGKPCMGGIKFDTPEVRALDAVAPPGSFVGAVWQVVSFDPIHVEPSLLCSCGDHGFIRGGRWVPV